MSADLTAHERVDCALADLLRAVSDATREHVVGGEHLASHIAGLHAAVDLLEARIGDLATPNPAPARVQCGGPDCERYGKVSMGARRYAVAEHVPNSVGWATRIADFIAVDCYRAQRPRLPLRNEIHGHEIKVSRSDWLTELRDPSKAQAFKPYCHRWWLVVSDRSIVKDDELPDGWGLLAWVGVGLRCIVPAPLLTPEPMPFGMTAALLRAVAKTASATPNPDGER